MKTDIDTNIKGSQMTIKKNVTNESWEIKFEST